MAQITTRDIRRSSAKHKLDRWIAQHVEGGASTIPVIGQGKNHLVAEFNRGRFTFCGMPATESFIPLTPEALKDRNDRGLVCLKCAKAVVL